MIHAKIYEKLSQFVKVMTKYCWSLFS